MEGDRNVFWLDTSGWLNEDVGGEGMPDEQDFYLDGEFLPGPSTSRVIRRYEIQLSRRICRTH